tara:strand:+ start:3955 stop:4362 length:408 start_codon:yes stop_codon:yes gene_type:complete
LKGSRHESSIFVDDSDLKIRMEDYFERFTNHLRALFIRHFKAMPPLVVLFDGTESRLPWHVLLNLDQPEKMQEQLLACKVDVKKGFDADAIVHLLGETLHPPFEDWGTFEIEDREVSTLRFTYAQRCEAELLKKA